MISIARFRTHAALALAALCLGVAGCSAGSNDSAAPTSGGGGAKNNGGAASPIGPPDIGTTGDGRAEQARDNGEVSTDVQPLSTFGLDVDTASYTFARAQIQAGNRPSRDRIRPEEFVNAFRQDYDQPSGNGFTINTDGARLPESHRAGGDAATSRLLRVGLQTRAEPASVRADAALTFVVDVSGSMAEKGKLDLVQDALGVLVDQLRPTDSVAIVSYSDNAKVVRPMTSARDRAALHQAIDNLKIAGSTNLEAGLRLGYQVARDNFRSGITNRVILLSDGLPNVGNTSAEPILRQVREAAAKQIALLGVGVGANYGDAFMEELADKGDGFVVYVSTVAEARRVFVEQLPASLAVRALDAKAQVEFNPSVVASYRLIGYENRALAASAFRNDRVDGGEVGPGHSVTALYALHLRGSATEAGERRLADVRVRWADPTSRTPTELTQQVLVSDVDRPFESVSPRLRVCYVAAFFAEVLRASSYASEVRLNDLADLGRRAADATEDTDVDALVELIRAYGRLVG
jgi:Ca-activated chloride channel family protein